MNDESLRRLQRSMLAALPGTPARAASMLSASAALMSEAEWKALVTDAAANGVLGVLRPLLVAAPLPAAIASDLDRRGVIESLWHARVTQALVDAVDAISRAGVAVCAMKGPALAQRLYDPPCARPSLDVDLLVRPADLARASEALCAIGYQEDSGVSRDYLLEHSHHLHFEHPEQPGLELHFRAYAGFGRTLPAEALLGRAGPLTIAPGVDVLVPHPGDEVLYLAVHAAGHSFIRLLWLYDMKLLVLRHPELDWAAIEARAVESGLLRPAAAAFELLGDWLECRVPFATRERATTRTRLARRLVERVSAPSTPSALDNLGGLVYTSLLCDRAVDGIGLFAHHTSRTLKRKLHAAAPRLLPPAWAE